MFIPSLPRLLCVYISFFKFLSSIWGYVLVRNELVRVRVWNLDRWVLLGLGLGLGFQGQVQSGEPLASAVCHTLSFCSVYNFAFFSFFCFPSWFVLSLGLGVFFCFPFWFVLFLSSYLGCILCCGFSLFPFLVCFSSFSVSLFSLCFLLGLLSLFPPPWVAFVGKSN